MVIAPTAVTGIIAALTLCVAICSNAGVIGARLHVVDKPDAVRKHHAAPTPLIGGIAIMVPLALWCALMLFTDSAIHRPLFLAVLMCGSGVALVGFTDDQSNTTPLSRSLMLVIFLALAFTTDSSLISHMLNWGSMGPASIALWAYCLLMAVTAVGLVNAVNMADGQDGIVGSMFVVWSLCLMLVSGHNVAAISEVLLILSVAVLCFNLFGRLFLGDCGTYGVTFVIGLLVMHAHAQGHVSLETIIVWFFIPVMDCLRLIITRPMRGRSPVVGDRDHFHHRLEDKLGKRFGLVTYASIVAVSSLAATLEPRFSLVCLTILTAIYFSFARLTDPAVAAEEPGAGHLGADNIVALNSANTTNEHKRLGTS